METIKVVFTFDESYVLQGLVSALSLLDADEGHEYGFYFLSETPFPDDVISEFGEYLTGFENLKFFKFLSLDHSIGDVYESRHLTRSTYLRLEIPEVICEEKIIYVDVDVVFLSGLNELWMENVNGYLLAASLDVGLNRERAFSKKLIDLPYWNKYYGERKGSYFQARLLLMNLKEIRERKLVNRWRELCREKFEYHDMDVLNISCFPYIKKINAKYNIIPGYFVKKAYEQGVREGYFKDEEVDEMYKRPIMLHFAGAKKPWSFPSSPGGYEYWRFLKKYPGLQKRIMQRYTPSLSEKIRKFFSKPLFV